MIVEINQTMSLWTWLAEGRDVSLALAISAVAVAAIVDVLVRLARARTARRLRIAAAAYAQRELSKEPPQKRNPVPRLSASDTWRLKPAYSE